MPPVALCFCLFLSSFHSPNQCQFLLMSQHHLETFDSLFVDKTPQKQPFNQTPIYPSLFLCSLSFRPMDKSEKKQQPKPRKPSFSSTLLDAIYRSTKQVDKEGGLFLNRETMRKKQSISISHLSDGFHKLQRNAKEITETLRPKHIRTGSVVSSLAEITPQRKTQLPKIQTSQQQKPKQETFNKAIDLKKKKKMQKPPISPGGRVASFFNSLFKASATPKKANGTSTLGKPKPDRSSSTPMSSCLCKAPSSRGNSLKSVRFYPVSVIFDEDCKSCGQKRIDDREQNLGHRPSMIGKELRVHVMEKTRRVEEAARELLHGYRKKSELLGAVMRDLQETDVRDFDDGTSCSSSDLFELENLAVVGSDRYREELPVYETTRIDTNRSIARSSLC